MEEKDIPKIIHYCWFGRGEKPELVKKCIESFKNITNDYQLIEWNEENFDVNKNKFVKEAYENKKYAFVSDYVRVYALYNFGGIYLDTDVEILKTFDNYLKEESFWGIEAGNFIATSTIGAKKGNKLIKEFLDSYKEKSFNETTNVEIITKIFKEKGLKIDGAYEKIEGLCTIYPMNIFSPYDYRYYEDLRDENTICIHYYYKSWISKKDKLKQIIKKNLIKIFGKGIFIR